MHVANLSFWSACKQQPNVVSELTTNQKSCEKVYVNNVLLIFASPWIPWPLPVFCIKKKV